MFKNKNINFTLFGGKRINSYEILKMKIDFPLGFEPPIHRLWIEFSTSELFDLLMNLHKINVYTNTDVFVYISVTVHYTYICLKITNCACEQFRTKCYVKIASNLISQLRADITVMFYIEMRQECYIAREA